jgi:hypothetical protein
MTVPRLVISAATMVPNALLEDRGAAGVAVRPAELSASPLLTDCSQTVRILLDVATHVHGKHAGQARNGGHVCTSWDRLVGSNPGGRSSGGLLCRCRGQDSVTGDGAAKEPRSNGVGS